MVNEVSLEKAQKLRHKSMSVGMQFLNEKVAVGKIEDNYNSLANTPKANEDKNKDRQ